VETGVGKPIEQILVGEMVLARNECEPNGPLELKQVEELFTNTSPLIELEIGGQKIGTTEEHPFYVPAREAFVPARELQVGDHLVSHDAQLLRIDAIQSTLEIATVYNLRVADYHTYFVGCDEWGFSVWAHNLCSDTISNADLIHDGTNLGGTARARQVFLEQYTEGSVFSGILHEADGRVVMMPSVNTMADGAGGLKVSKVASAVRADGAERTMLIPQQKYRRLTEPEAIFPDGRATNTGGHGYVEQARMTGVLGNSVPAFASAKKRQCCVRSNGDSGEWADRHSL
jgi:hypothetical protein